jgi:hypothetical protein
LQLHLHQAGSTTISKVAAKVFSGIVIFIINLVQIPKLGDVAPLRALLSLLDFAKVLFILFSVFNF